MKYLFIIISIFITSFVYSLDGIWEFNNNFSQRIENGTATIDTLNISLIKSIDFSNIRYNLNNDNNYPLMRGYIELFDLENNKFVKYSCLYIDLDSVITIKILTGNEINISLFVKTISPTKKYYSYAISSVIQYGIIQGTKEHDTSFMNFIGIMNRL